MRRKKSEYQQIQTKYTLCKDIADLYPYEITLPKPPRPEQIINYGIPAEEQVFKRVVMPPEIRRLNTLPREEAIAAVEKSAELSEFVATMWHKFTYGEWQYINGEALHISPTYWFYLNFWKLDVGLPAFRYDKTHYCTDLWEFIWWDYLVQPSEVCYGEIQGSKRRGGKTFKAMCKAYKRAMSNRNAGASIQSKTEADAIKAFSEKMVTPWTYLPLFFRPSHSNSSFPKAEGLQFMPPSKKGKGGLDVINPDNYLFSRIIPLPSSEKAADGYKWCVHISDEDGKTEECNTWERHTIIKPSLTEENRIIGKELCTTTVEDMERGGGANFCYKWNLSDRTPVKPNKKDVMVNEDGETVSGLWQWFCPARCNEVFDMYGCAIVEEPTSQQKEWLRDVKKDRQWQIGGRERIKQRIAKFRSQADRHREMRKYPEEVRDMFLVSTGMCYFDLGILQDRIKHFAFGYSNTNEAAQMTFGNLVWRGGVFGGEVDFVADEQDRSKFWISYLPSYENQNKWKTNPFDGKRAPANWHKFCAGADAFKFDTSDVINKNKMSLGSMHIYAEYDINVDTPDKNPMDYVTDDICLEYLWREDSMTVDDLCEDYLKACIFYGCKLFPEKNNPEVVKYFKNHGFEHYLQFDMEFKKTGDGVYMMEKGGAGANTDVKSIQSMFKVVQRYVKEKGMRCKFYRTLQQLTMVQPDDMNPYDLFVSLATCLRVVQEFNPIMLKEDEDSVGDISDIIGAIAPSYAGIGGRSPSSGDDIW